MILPIKVNYEVIKPIRSIILRTLNDKAIKHGTRPTSRFQLHQTSVNTLHSGRMNSIVVTRETDLLPRE